MRSLTFFLCWAGFLCGAMLLPTSGHCQGDTEALKSYHYEIKGNLNEKLKELIIASIDTATLQDRPPRSLTLLTRRMQDDVPTIQKILRSLGYFKNSVTPRLDSNSSPVTAIFDIAAGPRFTFGKVSITTNADVQLPSAHELGLSPGKPYAAQTILNAQDVIVTKLGENGHPFPKVQQRKITAENSANRINVTYVIDPGPTATFGETTFSGLDVVSQTYTEGMIPWKQGDPFDSRLLTKARATMIKSGLFTAAALKKGEVSPKGELPITAAMTERPPRTFRAGLRYRTSGGPGGKLEWEHRTLFGNGEHFRAGLDVDLETQELYTSFTKPNFLVDPMALHVDNKASRERHDAYDSDAIDSSVGLSYALSPEVLLASGVGYRYANVTSQEEEETFGLISLPNSIRWETRDNIMDPSKGFFLSAGLTPYIDTLGNAADFLKNDFSYRHYFSLLDDKSLILALRARIGFITGADLEQIPADIRFYAGGGGSVRGYAYQEAGDIKNGDPTGGRSLFESSAELRWRFYGDFGLVAFLDAGRAYADPFPDVGDEIFFGAGLGARYYTGFGPVGVDVAIPVNPRSGEDSPFQIYVSLGQAF